VMSIASMIIFPRQGSLVIDRPAKFGGPLEFASYKELEDSYRGGKLHPMDLKNGVGAALADVLEPVRIYFKRNPGNLEALRQAIR
jgi:tyrosyl-tRNA synthetase